MKRDFEIAVSSSFREQEQSTALNSFPNRCRAPLKPDLQRLKRDVAKPVPLHALTGRLSRYRS